MNFAGIPIVTNTALRTDEIYITTHDGARILITPDLTDEEREAKLIADRLLNRDSGLTLEMLQQAIDKFGDSPRAHRPTSILMSSATRRKYIELLHYDTSTPW